MNSLQQMLQFIKFPLNPTENTFAWTHRQVAVFDELSHGVNVGRTALEGRVDELIQRNRQVEATSMAKTRLFAAAIHDLRQPLQALILFTDALSEDEADPVRLQRIEQIRRSVDSLDRLFTGLLDLTQIDAGRMLPECRDLALEPLLDEVRHSFQAVAQAQGLRLVVRHTRARVHGDCMMLTRILNNLVCNALRHTQVGGVVVGTRHHEGGIRIDVCDTGIGIAPQHQSRVFSEFYKVRASGSGTQGEGLGLGLATVQRLADLQGATVRLRSRPGRGTVVSVLLPSARAEGA